MPFAAPSPGADRDRGNLEAELLLADMELVEKRLERLARESKSGLNPVQDREKAVLDKAMACLEDDRCLRELSLTDSERATVRSLDLVTFLPVLSVYAHLSDVASVNLGEYVSSDRQIGAVGNSGTSDEGDDGGAHLHLEVYVGDEYWTPREPRERGHAQAPARRRELRRATLHAFGWRPSDG